MNLWENTPGMAEVIPTVVPYIPAEKKSNMAVIICPGGGYGALCDHEGAAYAKFFAENGITAFVLYYRVFPHLYPLPLNDSRRAVRFVRAHAEGYGIDPDKIAIMGSSAGGHLAALTATFGGELPNENIDEIDKFTSTPNAQILCYPVIIAPDENNISHAGSYGCLLGCKDSKKEKSVDPSLLVTKNTPPAFIWHTSDDGCVNVINSYRYATALRQKSIDVEMHIFPNGPHGSGLAYNLPHVAQWSVLLLNWLDYIGWTNNQ